MVTPLSQFVGSQAAINVILGERYKEVTDQVDPFRARPVRPGGRRSMDPDVRTILDRPRAREISRRRATQPTIDDMRRDLGGAGVSDEELLLRWMLNKDDIAAMRAAGPTKEYVTARHPWSG